MINFIRRSAVTCWQSILPYQGPRNMLVVDNELKEYRIDGLAITDP
jgi:hypothetical protein